MSRAIEGVVIEDTASAEELEVVRKAFHHHGLDVAMRPEYGR
jgi:hypothetical protein